MVYIRAKQFYTKMKKKKSPSPAKMGKKEVRRTVEEFLSAHAGQSFSLRNLFKQLSFTSHPLKMLCIDVLNEMLDDEAVVRNADGEVSIGRLKHVVEGTFTRTHGGRNFVDLPDGTGVSVYDEDTLHALPGDKVRVSLFAKRRSSSKLHGQVIEILERSNKPFIGTLQVHHTAAFLLMQGPTALPNDILIPLAKLNGGKDGDKVLVRVTEWPQEARNPRGEVVDVLGQAGDNNTEMHAILAEFGLPYRYPENVEKAAANIPATISAEEIGKREDMRSVTTFTIDPRDAKDFDDALSIRPLTLPSGSPQSGGEQPPRLWEVGVHIADVSHYVTEGSVIDKEGQQRATSVYLVDRTIPMLPERLSNFICSLRPDEEKLCYSVIFDIDSEANVRASRIVHTVIKSDRRFAYEEVQYLLEQAGEASPEDMLVPTQQPKPVETEEFPDVAPAQPRKEPLPAEHFREELITLNRLAHILRQRRMKDGAISFDREEVRFEIDADGKPLRVYFKRAKDANKLIEEFMLLANRTVAERIGRVPKSQRAKTLPYRIHDTPDPHKLDELSNFVGRLGYRIITQGRKKEIARSLNKLLDDVKGQKMQVLVENVTLRAMMKAKYSTVNIGHYGLGFDFYTHFTSPIRRYPDLMVHRLLTRYLDEQARSASQPKYERLCEHSSEMEQLAANAERASIKYKQVEFLSDKIGQEFNATVSGVTDFGIYAEIDENKCEGLIAVRYLGDEPFDFDEPNFRLVGRHTHTVFTIGDKLRIKVAQANLERKQLDFHLVARLGEQPKKQKTYFSLDDKRRKK